MFGLPEHTLSLLRNYFSRQTNILEVWVYGSRAKGNYREGSDVDLSVVTSADTDISAKIQSDLDDLSTPYLFDVNDYQRIKHLPLKEHIDRVKKILYVRSISF